MSTTPRLISLSVRIPLTLLAAYLVARGLAEPFVIDLGDPSTYRLDWGGPSLAGVLAVHSGPAVLILGWLGLRLSRGTR